MPASVCGPPLRDSWTTGCEPQRSKESGMSGQIVHLEPDPHVAVQKLLPWYLTGRLEDGERAQVDEHLADCPECRAELEAERSWQLLQPGEAAQADVEAGWANMRALLGGHAARSA